MKFLKIIALCSLVFVCVRCLSDQPRESVVDPLPGEAPPLPDTLCTEASANYRVTFNATWSAQTHPTDFPSSPHFSRLIGGLHNSSVVFWKEGMLASQGIENMAELGSTSTLMGEVNLAISQGKASTVLLGNAIIGSPDSDSITFTMDNGFPLVTLVSMVAPSPDWFVGVDSLSLCENNEWVATKTVQLQPYDSGSDAGVSYESADSDIEPQIPIVEITGDPFLNNGSVAPLGTFVFEKI